MNRLLKYIYCICFCCCLVVANAKENYGEKFNQAKQLFLATQYDDAMKSFMALTKEGHGNNFVETSHYYYALSAFKNKQMQEAYTMLLQLLQKYPTWNNVEEAQYLAAATSFELKKYRYALNFLKDRSAKLQADVEDIKIYYLSKVQPLDSLIALQKAYAKDPVVARITAKRLNQARPLNEKNSMLLQYLVQEYKLPSSVAMPPQKAGITKASYNVAVLFPFMLASADFENYRINNSYITELYMGMLVAVDSLRKTGVNINLLAYDTEKENGKLATLLQSAEMKNMDMIVGPLLPAQNAAVSEFARANQIEVVNPLSNNSKLFDKNPFVYLFQPSLEAQAGQTARFAEKNLTSAEKNKVAIYYGETTRDSLLALYYRDSLVARKIAVPIYERLKKERLFRMTSTLSDSAKLDGFSHVFISSTDEIIAANVISALEKSQNNIPLITRSEWLQLSTLSLEQLQKRQVHFISPEFVDYDNPALANFKKGFATQYNMLPTQYVYTGFDLLTFFGTVLKNGGTNFKKTLLAPTRASGVFLSGMDFTRSNTNNYVPIVKFEEMKLKVMNPLEK